MEKIVFCKISCMKYYKGAGPNDMPYNGGSFVNKNGYGYEEYNFFTRKFAKEWVDVSGTIQPGEYYLGHVETKSTYASKRNQLHVEKIRGFNDTYKNQPSVSGVTVIWCATTDLNETSVVGWYKNATVYREYQTIGIEDGTQRTYNVLAHAADCVLLPQGVRHKYIWKIPLKKHTKVFGFGQSMLWYAQEEEALSYLQHLTDSIDNYKETKDTSDCIKITI
ncbi:MAG: hypothetical protein ACK5JF_01810 [Oscillospiraceae bacterium]